MTIGRTGNSVVDELARAKSRAQAADERARASAKKAAGRSKTTAKARRGRAAIRGSKGRGVAGSSHKNRTGAGASIQYAIDKPDAKLISSNAGMDSKDIAASFRLAQDSRPDIKKNTGHMSFSLPAGEKLTDNQWSRLADCTRAHLGLDDGFPFVAGLHEDTDHQHLHITYGRVSYDGRVHDDRFIKLRLAAVEDNLEKEFSLKIIPREEFIKAPRYTIGEAAMSAKTGIQPPRLVIDTAIRVALANKPKDPQVFIQQLAERGVIARPAIKGGKMSGFSFQYKGVEFGASKISNEFGWKKLQGDINFESNKHDAQLADFAASLPAKPKAGDIARQADNREIRQPDQRMQQFEQPTFNGTEEKPKPQAANRKPEITEVRADNRNSNNDCNVNLPRNKRTFDEIFRSKCFPSRQQVIGELKAIDTPEAQPEQCRLAAALITLIEKSDFAEGAAKVFLKQEKGSEEAIKMVLDFVREIPPETVKQCCTGFEVLRRLEHRAQAEELAEGHIIVTEQVDEYRLPAPDYQIPTM